MYCHNEDIVRDTGAGRIVKSKEPVSMAEGLHEFASDAAQRERLSATALAGARCCDWREVAAMCLALYCTVLALGVPAWCRG